VFGGGGDFKIPFFGVVALAAEIGRRYGASFIFDVELFVSAGLKGATN
jgi:hypothetical protein